MKSVTISTRRFLSALSSRFDRAIEKFVGFFKFTEADAMALLSAYGLGALEVERVQRNLSEQAEPFDRLRASPSDRLKIGPFDGLRTGRFDELKTRSAPNGGVGSTPGIAGNHWPIPIGIHPEYNSGSWRWRVPSNAQRRNF